jgi:flagellar hook-length control protein FliK
MLPRADQINGNGPRSPASIEATAPITAIGNARQDIYSRLSQIALGKQLLADVLSQFDDGTFLVRIADTAARVALPMGTRVGDQIPLQLVTHEPRPTFLLAPPESSTPAQLSSTARLIDHVLQLAQKDGTPAAVVADTPLLPTQPGQVNPEKLATAMHEQLEFSGMFYESHLQQWLAGSRSQALLEREPQAQPGASIEHDPQTAAGQHTAKAAPGALVSRIRDLLAAPDSGPRIKELLQHSGAQPATPSTNPATDVDLLMHTEAAQLPQVQPEAARLISLQLNTLEQQQLQWQGELWPGQRLEWSVSQDAAESGSQAPDEPSWTSVVRFRLPALGEVAATVRLCGSHVRIDINTPDPTVAASLRRQTPHLADALAAAGSRLDALLVQEK